jgi:putative radical SAM enzyme (TIGR03279 family)
LLKTKNYGPAPVAGVEAGSAAEAAGIKAGDLMVRIDGRPLRDLIDVYVALSDDRPHAVEVRRGNDTLVLDVDCGGTAPGLEVSEPVFGEVATCTNNCVFCFVDQLPEGLRQGVYLKDDDYRLSFLAGNFITLTNLGRADVRRIKKERLSPLYVSLHSTERGLRETMFGNPRAGRALKVLAGLLEDSIDIHIQIVVMRGLNDGEHLDRTLADLLERFSGVKTVGVVPVGLSEGGRKTLPPEYGHDRASAEAIIEQLEGWRTHFGDAGPFAADEFFFMAGQEPPDAGYYGEFEQLENGIGIARLFRDSFIDAGGAPRDGRCEGLALVTTAAGAWGLGRLGIEEAGVDLVVCENTLFGEKVNVCGLLPGQGAAAGLEQAAGARLALVPSVALDCEAEFIDGVTLGALSDAAGIAVEAVECSGRALAESLERFADGGCVS